MRQNIGLTLQTIGYILLSLSVFSDNIRRFINFPWNKKPFEVRAILSIMKIKNNNDYSKLFDVRDYPIPENFSLKQRIIYDLPLIALIFIIIGFLLNLYY